ncbi:MAG TPA: hypothetical protein VJZ68_08180 [Nitrososphaera sp.]|nr:hypothetical protein [Nitrososphaera sp.]
MYYESAARETGVTDDSQRIVFARRGGQAEDNNTHRSKVMGSTTPRSELSTNQIKLLLREFDKGANPVDIAKQLGFS